MASPYADTLAAQKIFVSIMCITGAHELTLTYPYENLLLPYFSDTGNYSLCSTHVYARIFLKPFSLGVNVQKDCISLGSCYNINF